jgi:hypothetical protein
MRRRYTYPTLLDEIHAITLSDFKKCGNLVPGSVRSDTITWTNRFTGNKTGSVDYTIDMRSAEGFIELSYHAGGNSKRVRITLVGVPSNLGNGGHVCYFVCPTTKLRCRVLYRHGDDFFHRNAIPNAMYSGQSLSKNWRGNRKRFVAEKVRRSFHQKYARTHYNGVPTKRFSRFLKQQKRSSHIKESGLRTLRDSLEKKWGDLVMDYES